MSQQPISITSYDTSITSFAKIKIERAATGFQFAEGPAWHPDGFLLFSDIPANKIMKLTRNHALTVFMEPSGFMGTDRSLLSDQPGSNGLAIDDNENLIICQHGNHALSKLDKDGVLSVLTGLYEGRRYNSPNDTAIHSSGTIYFTDPPYGLKDRQLNPEKFQPVAAVYRYKNADVTRIITDFSYPNGICFSPDESFLYVSSNHRSEPFLRRYPLLDTREIKNGTVLIEQNADGIKTDKKGNLFLSTREGVMIISAEGKKLALLSLPEPPSNIAWVKPGYNQLYITTPGSVYLASGFL
jgi:gluconolactonase